MIVQVKVVQGFTSGAIEATTKSEWCPWGAERQVYLGAGGITVQVPSQCRDRAADPRTSAARAASVSSSAGASVYAPGVLRLVRSILAALPAGVLALAACSSAPEPIHPADDLAPYDDTFDASSIVDGVASFTDPFSLPLASDVQTFLKKTPYDRPSFLATYSSNGVRASDAIAAAAVAYQINPMVFLVRAEVDQGLVAATSYPTPAARVEYAFGCGCSGGVCDAAYAGFDRQVDCLGRTLRGYLDQACGVPQQTQGGWAADKTSTSLDGVQVTPTSAATAVLYQYDPVVGLGASDNWMFWNLWLKYSDYIGYGGAFPDTWVGDACCGDATCTFDGATCAVNVPGGACTAACDASTPCPTDPNRAAVCASLAGQGFCLLACNPGECRPGYKCAGVNVVGGGTASACLPQ